MVFGDGGGGCESKLWQRRPRCKHGNLARSPSMGSQTPLLVAKQRSMIVRRFIRKARETTSRIICRRNDSLERVTCRTNTVDEDNDRAAEQVDHGAAATSSSSDNSISSENMTVYTSGTKNHRLHFFRPMYGSLSSATKGIAHTVSTHPFDEETLSLATSSWKATSSTARAAACGGGGELESLWEDESHYTYQAFTVYDDPTFVPEDSTVEDSIAAAEPYSPGRVAVETSHRVSYLQRQQYPQPNLIFPETPADSYVCRSGEEIDCLYARGVEILDFAKKLLSKGNREGSLQLFRRAARHFEAVIAQTQNNSTAVLGLVHSARCHRYMSSIVSEPDDAIRLLHAVVRLYSVARERLEEITDSNAAMKKKFPNTNPSEASYSFASGQSLKMATRICLDSMIVETLQFQASLLVQRLDDYDQAIICYEEILRQLLHIEELQYWEDTPDRSALLDDINFVPISKAQHAELLREALTVLATYYATLLPRNESCSFVLFEDALNLLRVRQEEQYNGDNDMANAVSSLYKQLSEIYTEHQQSDRAVLALRDFAVVKLTGPGEPCIEALEIIERMGKTHERMENYSDALECYELALLSRCRHYGNTHVSVAKALVNVARMKELNDGNSIESVNLYRAANAIFSLHVKADETRPYSDHDHRSSTLPHSQEQPQPSAYSLARCEQNESSDALYAGGKSLELLPDKVQKSLKSPPALEVLPLKEEESDDDSDTYLIQLPSAYTLGDCDDVKTVFSSDNDIVTLSSGSHLSSRSLGQSDIFSVDPESAIGTEKQGSDASLEQANDHRRGYDEDDASPISRTCQSSITRVAIRDSRPFTKIFSLSDVLNRIQHSRQSTKTKNKT